MPTAFNEMFLADGNSRPGYEFLKRWLESTPDELLAQRRAEAELLFRRIGITFAVYGNADAEERIIPFDIVPRVLTKSEWPRLSRGLEQRVKALNAFLADVYGAAEIIAAGKIPADLVYRNPYFRPEMVGVRLAHDIYIQIAGIEGMDKLIGQAERLQLPFDALPALSKIPGVDDENSVEQRSVFAPLLLTHNTGTRGNNPA